MAEAINVPILCRLWEEDHIWNAVVEHLPVAVSGATFEEARGNLRDALQGHIETVIEIGDFSRLLEDLREHSHEYMSVTELPLNSAMVPMQAALRDRHLVALT